MSDLRVMGMAIVFVVCPEVPAQAVVPYPTQVQVDRALKKGTDFAKKHRPPNELHAHFGSTEPFEARGFLVTKISGLAVMTGHYVLRGEQPTGQAIQRVLDETALQVIVTVFGDSPGFARDSYLIMKQGEHVVKPHRIRFDAHARKVSHDHGDAVYRAKIVGEFPYETFNPTSSTTLLVFPGLGGEIHFTVDLSIIP